MLCVLECICLFLQSSLIELVTIACSILLVVFAIYAFRIYEEQADISDTSNLMTTWCEHNRIMASINDPANEKIKPLKYFELIMFFERICTLYYIVWGKNEKMKERFHVLYDETIDAHCRKHFANTIKSLYTKQGRYIYEYGLSNIVKYFYELKNSSNKDERHINHILSEYSFDIEEVLNFLETLYTKRKFRVKREFNKKYFDKYREELTK